jgi:hypothetical protein
MSKPMTYQACRDKLSRSAVRLKRPTDRFAEADPRRATTTSADRFVLSGEGGGEAAVLESIDGRPSLRLNGKDGLPRLSLDVFADDTPNISLTDANFNTRLMVFLTEGGSPGGFSTDAGGNPCLSFGVSADNTIGFYLLPGVGPDGAGLSVTVAADGSLSLSWSSGAGGDPGVWLTASKGGGVRLAMSDARIRINDDTAVIAPAAVDRDGAAIQAPGH